MEDKTIIIADKDVEFRGNLTGFFRKAGYRVEATGSADQVLRSIHDRRAPVLLLGSAFGSKPASAELVRLLKKYNRHLQIVMFCEEMSLAQSRQVRQEGIFYQALRPATADEAAELGQVVACAFAKQATDALQHPGWAALHKGAAPERVRPHLMHALPWVVGLVALTLAANYLSFSSVGNGQDSNNFGVWLFLGFCSMIVIGQLLPIFRIKLAPGRAAQAQKAAEHASRGGK